MKMADLTPAFAGNHNGHQISMPGFEPLQGAEMWNGARPCPDAAHACKKVEQSMAYMAQHLHESLQVSTLAALAKVSPSHFFALFKRATGRAPIDYFIHLKISRACELLDGTSLNIKEVAARLGYEDQFYFSRAFKLVVSLAPRQYRRLPPQSRAALKETVTSGARPPRAGFPERISEFSPGKEVPSAISDYRNGSIPANCSRNVQPKERCHAKA